MRFFFFSLFNLLFPLCLSSQGPSSFSIIPSNPNCIPSLKLIALKKTKNIGSHGPISVLAQLLEVNSIDSAEQALSVIILHSLLVNTPSILSEQLSDTISEKNKFFNVDVLGRDFVSIEGLKPIHRIEISLGSFLFTEGLFEFIRIQRTNDYAKKILEGVENLAKVLCPKRANQIKNFIAKFPSLHPLKFDLDKYIYHSILQDFLDKKDITEASTFELLPNLESIESLRCFLRKGSLSKLPVNEESSLSQLGFDIEDLSFFENWVRYVASTNQSSSIPFLKNDQQSNSKLTKFFGNSKHSEEIIALLIGRGIFYVLANRLHNKYTQKVLRLFDTKFRELCAYKKIPTRKSKDFWACLRILKDVEEIDSLAMILLHHAFCSGRADNKNFLNIMPAMDITFFAQKMKSDDIEALNHWQAEFCGFESFFPSASENRQQVTAAIWDLSLSIEQKIRSNVAEAIYDSCIKFTSFGERLREIFKLTNIDGEEVEQLYSIESPFNAFQKLGRGTTVIKFLYQHASLFKSTVFAERIEKLFESIPDGLGSTKVDFKISKIISKAFLDLGQLEYSDAKYLSDLCAGPKRIALKWIKTLDDKSGPSFYNSLILKIQDAKSFNLVLTSLRSSQCMNNQNYSPYSNVSSDYTSDDDS